MNKAIFIAIILLFASVCIGQAAPNDKIDTLFMSDLLKTKVATPKFLNNIKGIRPHDLSKQIRNCIECNDFNRFVDFHLGLHLDELTSRKFGEGSLNNNTWYAQILYDDLATSSLVYNNAGSVNVYAIQNNGKKIYAMPTNKGVVFLKDTTVVQEMALLNSLIAKNMKKMYDSIEYRSQNADGKGKIIHQDVFNKNMSIIKQAVILNSSDDMTTSSGVAVTSSKDGTDIGANFNMNLHDRLFLNIGANTNSEGGFLYSEQSWATSIGGTANFNWQIVASQFYDPAKAKKLDRLRKDYTDSIVNALQELHSLQRVNESLIKELKKQSSDLLKADQMTLKSRYDEIESNHTKITVIQARIKEYERYIKDPSVYVDQQISSFDERNIEALQGARLQWFRLGLSAGHTAFKQDFGTIKEPDTLINSVPRFSAELAYNFYHNKKHMIHFQFFGGTIRGSLLDARQDKKEPVVKEEKSHLMLYDDKNNRLGRYEDVKKPFYTFFAGGQGFWFPCNKQIGGTLRGEYTFASNTLRDMTYKNRWNILFGPTFRHERKKNSAEYFMRDATMTFLVGWEDVALKDAWKDFFSFRLVLGVPFGT